MHANDLGLNLSRDDIARLFPAYIEIDSSAIIRAAGPSLSSRFRNLKGRSIFDIFLVERPLEIAEVAELRECRQALMLRSKCDAGHRLRGIVLDRQETIFLVVAYIPEIGGDADQVDYQFTDFSPTDGTLDMLLALELRSGLLADARQLAARLETERQAAERANKAKTSFLATMSHEIRTPMNGILGLASVLEETQLDGEQRELVTTMRKSGETLMNILSNVLDLSKIESGSLELEMHAFSVSDMVDSVYSLFQPLAELKQIEIRKETCVESDFLLGDSTRARQILTNFMSNAIKFTESGSVSLKVRDWKDGERIFCEMSITDTGIGMAPEVIDRLFEPFNQADNSTTRRFGGTGLGLAISKRLCEEMGGRVDVESRVGRGSSFVATIPFGIPEKGAAVARAEQQARHGRTSSEDRPPSVLVVEDNATNRLVVSKYLKQLGVKYDFAHDGVQALTAWEDGDYTIILMDIQMPNLDGLEATRELRRRERASGRERIPVIGLSADAMLQRRDEALEVGMDSFLTKPIRLSELEGVIRAGNSVGAP